MVSQRAQGSAVRRGVGGNSAAGQAEFQHAQQVFRHAVVLFDLLLEKGYDIRGKHLDCGMTIFDQQTQDTHAGGSGCGCAATVLSAYILPKIERGEWERVLFVPTGALMSTVSYNEGASVPGIAHAIVLEHEA